MSLGKGLRFLLGEHATFFRVAATGVATVFMRNWLFEFSMGGGPSMTPTLAERNSVVLDEKISARYGMLQPGDVVKCRVPHGKKKRKTCKRLIAYEDELVSRVVATEPPPFKPTTKALVAAQPSGGLWIEGDGWNSRDSRIFGGLPATAFVGRSVAQVFPLGQAKMLKRTLYPHYVNVVEAAGMELPEAHDALESAVGKLRKVKAGQGAQVELSQDEDFAWRNAATVLAYMRRKGGVDEDERERVVSMVVGERVHVRSFLEEVFAEANV